MSLDRVALKEKVIDSPEILSVLGDMPSLQSFLNGLYGCSYVQFMAAFPAVAEQARSDVFLHPHFRYFLREARCVAYGQFLESYKSVTLPMMAASFGVSSDFLDAELAAFIAAGRLNCKVDRVAGKLETTRPDTRSALYHAVLKKGDGLLNRIQKVMRND